MVEKQYECVIGCRSHVFIQGSNNTIDVDCDAVLLKRSSGKCTAQPLERCSSGARAVGFFFFLPINIENRKVCPKKTRVLMKNVCYLSALVLKSKYAKKIEDKI